MRSPPALVLVEGELGIGKSRLVQEALSGSRMEERQVLVGQCPRVREPFLLAPFVEALRGLAVEMPSGLLSPVVGALRPLVPELASQLPPCPEPLDGAGVARHQLFRAFRELLEAQSAIVLVLEDLHWADPGTVELLEFLLAHPPGGVSLILTYRREELDAGAPMLALPARVPRKVLRETLSLSPLKHEEIRELAGAILGRGEVSEQLGRVLGAWTAGVPAALEELLQSLEEAEQLTLRDGCWVTGDLRSLGVPTVIRDSVSQRLAALDADARLTVEAGAVLGAGATEELIGKVAGLVPSRSRRGMSRALTSGLVREVGEGAFGMRHALAERSVYEGIPSPERRAFHLRAARAQEATPQLGCLARAAYHFRWAGRPQLWLRYAERAAGAAAAVGDDRGATRLLEGTLSAPNASVAARARIAVKLGDAALFGRTPGRAIAPLREMVQEGSLRRGIRGELRFCLARLLCQVGDSAQGYQELVRSADELSSRPALAARVMSNLAATWPTEGGPDEACAWLDRAVETERRQQDPAVTTHVVASRAVLLLEADDPAGWRASEDVAWGGHSAEQAVEVVRACKYFAATASLLGYCDRAERLIEQANQIRHEIGNQRFGVGLATVESELRWITGDWQGLEARARQLAQASAEARVMSGRSELILGWLLLARGEVEEAERLLAAALGALRRARPGSSPTTATAGLMRVHLARGDTNAARDMAMLALEALRSNRTWALSQAVPPVIVEALLACHANADARAVATELARGLRGRDAPAGRAGLAVCRGLLAEAQGRRPTAARWFARAEQAWQRLPCPYEAARARERRGDCLLSQGDPVGGDCLLDALKDFDGLGASWDSARIKALLRAHGVPLPYPWRGGRRRYEGELSPREREVAELAGRGRTSPEIAQALYLSPRTVESHVASAMRKLGVASRRGLASAAEASLAGDSPARTKIG